MAPIVSIKNLSKTYDSGQKALSGVSLDIEEGEILALLGPNGAGKTTLISIICGIVTPTGGSVEVGGFDVIEHYREARAMIGLVPQDIALEPFEKVVRTVSFSRGLFGRPPDPGFVDGVLEKLSLLDKKNSPVNQLSGGMRRRVLIAKALAHEPRVLFLDEPSAGVDVELRKGMWETIRELQKSGVTIILTTHYIEEAESMADRIGIISHGELLLAEEKTSLMGRLGRKQMRIDLQSPLAEVPDALAEYHLELADDGSHLIYTYDTRADRTGITALLNDLNRSDIRIRDVQTSQSSLEEIFVGLVKEKQ